MKLLELFDEGVNVDWVRWTDSVGRAEFEVDYTFYRFSMSTGTLYLRDINNDRYDTRTVPSWDVAFAAVDENGDEEYGNTETGNQFHVYATILRCIREFITEKGVRPINFSADDEGRQRLYVRFIKRFLPDWTIHQVHAKRFVVTPPGYEKDIAE